mmetsp:Transcript_30437/g.35104  ORF Transcript_30437/g.35104 Transcript_30437/m.35104 type:complete len:445 (+) Transcript_30437:77-1411(+)
MHMVTPGDTARIMEKEKDRLKQVERKRRGVDSEMQNIMKQRNNLKTLMKIRKSKSCIDLSSSAQSKISFDEHLISSLQKHQELMNHRHNKKCNSATTQKKCARSMNDTETVSASSKECFKTNSTEYTPQIPSTFESTCPRTCTNDDKFITFEKLEGYSINSETNEGARTPRTSNRDRIFNSSFSHDISSCKSFGIKSSNSCGALHKLSKEYDSSDEDRSLPFKYVGCSGNFAKGETTAERSKTLSSRKAIDKFDSEQKSYQDRRWHTSMKNPNTSKILPIVARDRSRGNLSRNTSVILSMSDTLKLNLNKKNLSNFVKNKPNIFAEKLSNTIDDPTNSTSPRMKNSRRKIMPIHKPVVKIHQEAPSFEEWLTKAQTNPPALRRQAINQVKSCISRSRSFKSLKDASRISNVYDSTKCKTAISELVASKSGTISCVRKRQTQRTA